MPSKGHPVIANDQNASVLKVVTHDGFTITDVGMTSSEEITTKEETESEYMNMEFSTDKMVKCFKDLSNIFSSKKIRNVFKSVRNNYKYICL